MMLGDAVALLDLLAARGIVGWLGDGDTRAGIRVVLDVSGLDGAMSLLVARGFAVVQDELPAELELVHPQHGRVFLVPAGFRSDGAARLQRRGGGELVLPSEAFDDPQVVPRRVRLRPEEDPVSLPEDDGGAGHTRLR
jgi:hypothetical protein